MDQRFTVTLTGPAKVAGKTRAAGEDVTVDTVTLGHLIASSAVKPSMVEEPGALAAAQETFDAAVAAKAEALSKAVLDQVVTEATAPLLGERDAALAKAEDCLARAEAAEARVEELEAQAKTEAAEQAGEEKAAKPATRKKTPTRAKG